MHCPTNIRNAAVTLSSTPVMAKMRSLFHKFKYYAELILLVALSEVFSNKVLSELTFSMTKYTISNIDF